jgi:hypothetical protein
VLPLLKANESDLELIELGRQFNNASHTAPTRSAAGHQHWPCFVVCWQLLHPPKYPNSRNYPKIMHQTMHAPLKRPRPHHTIIHQQVRDPHKASPKHNVASACPCTVHSPALDLPAANLPRMCSRRGDLPPHGAERPASSSARCNGPPTASHHLQPVNHSQNAAPGMSRTPPQLSPLLQLRLHAAMARPLMQPLESTHKEPHSSMYGT